MAKRILVFLLAATFFLTGCSVLKSENQKVTTKDVLNSSRVITPVLLAEDYFSIVNSNLRVVDEELVVGSVVLKCEKEYGGAYYSEHKEILDLQQDFPAYSFFPCMVTNDQWDYAVSRMTRAYLNNQGFVLSTTPYHTGEYLTISFSTGY